MCLICVRIEVNINWWQVNRYAIIVVVLVPYSILS